jgi:hypothetical protein
MNVRIRIAKFYIEVPTQRDKDRLMEATCNARTKQSRERIQQTNLRRPWNVVARG